MPFLRMREKGKGMGSRQQTSHRWGAWRMLRFASTVMRSGASRRRVKRETSGRISRSAQRRKELRREPNPLSHFSGPLPRTFVLRSVLPCVADSGPFHYQQRFGPFASMTQRNGGAGKRKGSGRAIDRDAMDHIQRKES